MVDRNCQSPVPIRYRLQTLFLFVAVVAALLSALLWLTRWPSFTIAGSAIAAAKMYTVETSDEFPHYLSIKVTGYIDGQAKVTTHGGRITTIGPGQVDIEIEGEWYESAADIQYSPQNVNRGRLVVRYKFRS